MRTMIVVLCLLALPACSLIPPLVAIEGGSVIISDKTATDHFASYASGKDCSSVRSELGKTYCKEDESEYTPTVYCYRTLGDITCYNLADPYNTKARIVGDNDHNLPPLKR